MAVMLIKPTFQFKAAVGEVLWPCCAEEEREVSEGQVTGPGSHSQQVTT